MTVSTTSNRVVALGNGITTVFNFSFIGVAAADLTVIYTDSSGTETTLTSSQYSVTLNAPGPGQLWGYGGSVTYPLSGSPIASGTSLTIDRVLPLTQLTSIANQGDFYPNAVEQALDYVTMVTQQLQDEIGRQITAPVSDPAGLNYVLPAVAQRAGQLLSFDDDGNVIVGQPSSVIVSSAMQPVVEAATTFLGAAAMGVIPVLANIAALEALSASNVPPIVWVAGYYAAGDGGEGAFAPGTATSANGCTIFNDSLSRSWYRQELAESISTAWAGCKGDGSTNDAANLLAAATIANGANLALRIRGTSGMNLSVGTNTTLNCILNFTDGGMLSPTLGTTLTIEKAIIAGAQQIFGIAGTIAISGYGIADQFNAMWWGAVGDGSTDNSGAINVALASLPSGGGILYFPAGTYVCDEQISFTFPNSTASISVVGAGQDATILTFPNANTGIVFNYTATLNSVRVQDLTLATSITNAGTALSLTRTANLEGAFPQNNIARVTIRGADGGDGTDYWTTGINVSGVSGVDFDVVTVYGESTGALCTAVSLAGDASASPNKYGLIFNFNGCTFNFCNGISYGTYVQGVTINQCNFTAGGFGVSLPDTSFSPAQLGIFNSQFNATSNNILITAGSGAGYAFPGIYIQGNLIFCPSGASGILLENCSNVSINGNEFSQDPTSPNSANGIVVGTGCASVSILGNTSVGLLNSVAIESGAQTISITGNCFLGADPSAGTGIGILATSGVACVISANQFDGLSYGVNVSNTANAINIQSNSYANVTTNTSPSSSTGNVKVGGGTP